MRKQIIAGAAVLTAAASCGVVESVFQNAFSRNPIQKFRLFGQGTEYEAQIEAGRQWMLAQKHRQVFVKSHDGLLLRGHYYTAPNAKRTVLMCHGWRGFWNYDLAPSAQWFYENGCNLLVIEQRAQGASEGRYMTFGLKERKDVLSWLRWLNHTQKAENIYLYGVSMGASTVLMAAAEKTLPDNVRGVIADCGFADPYEIVSRSVKKSGLPVHPTMDILQALCRRRVGIDLKECSPKKAVRHIGIPVLFVHGKEDRFVPIRMTLENYEECTAPRRLLQVEGAGHCMSFIKDPAAYTGAVEEMFSQEDV